MTELITVKDFINFAAKKFDKEQVYFGHGTDNPWDEAVYLVLSALDLHLDAGDEVLEKELNMLDRERLEKLIDDRVQKRTPIPYLTKEAWFAGLSFYVDERVLIPRSPLAELIQEHFIPWVESENVTRILDIGTGSGCIAIALAYAFPNAVVDAVDVSDDALDVADINLQRHAVVGNRVRFLKSDVFENLEGEVYDIIVSNPPYVGDLEMKSLPEEYSHEPTQALLSGKRGDEIVDKIIESAANFLKPGGILVVEAGNSAELVIERHKDLPFFWLDLTMGESEIFLLTKEQLRGGK